MNNYKISYSAMIRIKEELIDSFFGVENEHIASAERRALIDISNSVDKLAEIFHEKQ